MYTIYIHIFNVYMYSMYIYTHHGCICIMCLKLDRYILIDRYIDRSIDRNVELPKSRDPKNMTK